MDSPSLNHAPPTYSLFGVDLRGVDLSCDDGITVEQLRHAIIDQTTMLPPGLEHLVREVPEFRTGDGR